MITRSLCKKVSPSPEASNPQSPFGRKRKTPDHLQCHEQNHFIHSRRKSLILTALTSFLLTGVQARTWTNSDRSKTFEADLISSGVESGLVSVTLPNGKRLSFDQDKLFEDDITIDKENGTKPKATGSVIQLPEVLPDPDGEEADMSKPVQVNILMDQSTLLGFGNPDALKTVAQGWHLLLPG